MDHARIDELLARVNTESLQQSDVPTVALVVFNFSETMVVPCRVRFAAAFPTRAPKPVTVRNEYGSIVPSRIVRETITSGTLDLPAGKILWSLVLEFAVLDNFSPRTARAFAASYETSARVASQWEDLPLRLDLSVYETACHPGDLPTTFALTDFDSAL